MLVSGNNGVGKSTIIDALIYVLYNTSHRKQMNLPEMVNDKNNRKTLVTLEVTSGGNLYLIKRGMKPDILEGYQDGKRMNNLSSKALMNKYIINNIIGMEKDLFLQLYVIGKSNYKAILELTIPKRRELIENIFSMFVLSKMKDISKAKFKYITKLKDRTKVDIEKKDLEIEYSKKMLEEASNSKTIQIDNLNLEIESINKDISDLESDKSKISFNQEALSDLQSDIRTLNKELSRCMATISKAEGYISVQKGLLSDLERNGLRCPLCGSETPIEKIEKDRAEIEGKIDSNNKIVLEQGLDKDKLELELDKLQSRLGCYERE